MRRKKVFELIFSSVCAVALLGCICCSHMDTTNDDVSSNASPPDNPGAIEELNNQAKNDDQGQVDNGASDEIAKAMDQSGDTKAEDLDNLDGIKSDNSKSSDLTATAADKTDGKTASTSPSKDAPATQTASASTPPPPTLDDVSKGNGSDDGGQSDTAQADTDSTSSSSDTAQADTSSAPSDKVASNSDVKGTTTVAQNDTPAPAPAPAPEVSAQAEPTVSAASASSPEVTVKPHHRVVAHHHHVKKHHHELAQADVSREPASDVSPAPVVAAPVATNPTNTQVATAPIPPTQAPVVNHMAQLLQPNNNGKLLNTTSPTTQVPTTPNVANEKTMTASDMMLGNKKVDENLDSDKSVNHQSKRTLASADDLTDILQHNLWMVFVGAAGFLMLLLLVSRRVRRSRDHDLLD